MPTSTQQQPKTELVDLFLQLTNERREGNLLLPAKQAKNTLTEDEEQEEEVEQEKLSEPPESMYTKYYVTTEEMNAQTVWSIAPKEKVSTSSNDAVDNNKHVYYYLHGGTYVDGFTNQDWDFLAKLVDRLHCTITAPDYPLAPDYDVHDVFAMITPLYYELVESVGPSNLSLMGESAGGGMSLALAQWLRNEDIKQPSNIILFSPWLDATMTNPDISRKPGGINSSSSSLEIQELKKRGNLYAGKKIEPTNYLVSPIYGSFEDLAPITLFVCAVDPFVADCRKLKARVEAEGIILDYREFEDNLTGFC